LLKTSKTADGWLTSYIPSWINVSKAEYEKAWPVYSVKFISVHNLVVGGWLSILGELKAIEIGIIAVILYQSFQSSWYQGVFGNSAE
jgi:hypothetical protein